MDASSVLFWKTGPLTKLSAAEIARELMWGEEVEGLIDLPVREILDHLKAEFPQHNETPGLFVGHVNGGSFETTWTWQHIRATLHDLSEGERQRLIDAVEAFDCMAYVAS